MDNELLTSREVDRLFRYSSGKAVRLAKAGRLPHIILPDGSIRFREKDIEGLLTGCPSPSQMVAAQEGRP
jgi:predicted site-specific integrase-resolvase